MGKALKLVFEAVSNVIWLPWNNYARHDAKIDSPDFRRNIAVTLANEGWNPGMPIKIVALSKEGQAKAVEYLTSLWDALQGVHPETPFKDKGKVTKVSDAQTREAFELRWMSKGKIVAPTYEAIYAYQRGGCLDMAIAYAMAIGIEPIATLPCYIMEYKTEAERIKDCMDENYMKDALLNDVTNHWPSIIKGANAFFEATNRLATFSDITRLVSGGDNNMVGRAQKVWPILLLNARFPELGIVKRITEAGFRTENGREIDVGQEYGTSLDRKTLNDLVKGMETDAEKPTKESDIKAYFDDPSQAKPQPTKPLNATGVTALGKNAPNYLVRYVLQALADGKTAPANIAALDAIKAECNELLVASGLFVDGKPVFPSAKK